MLAVLHLSGCFSVQQYPRFEGPLPDSVVLEEYDPPRVLHHAFASDEAIMGWERTAPGDSVLVRAPLYLSEREFAGKKTALVVAGTLLGFVVAGAVALGMSGGIVK